MRIGTITYWWTQTNYGQVLQCYALIHFLKQMGHDAFLIRHDPVYEPPRLLSERFFSAIQYLLHPWRLKSRKYWNQLKIREKEDILKHNRHFDDFKKKYIPSTKVVTYDELKNSAPTADAYICGSDQIWGGLNPIYYLQFGKPHVKRLAYAPSMGGEVPPSTVLKRIKRFLSDFDFISAREKSDIRILKNMGFSDACLVPDPTLLLGSFDYRKLATNKLNDSERYVLVYLLGNQIDLSYDDLKSFAEEHGLKLKYVSSQGRIDDYEKLYPSIQEWLELVDKATYVITNSFHGTVFSLLFNTPFLTLPVVGIKKKMNNRIIDLLDRVGLSNRIYHHSLDEILSTINFDQFNKFRESESLRVSQIFSKMF